MVSHRQTGVSRAHAHGVKDILTLPVLHGLSPLNCMQNIIKKHDEQN